MYSIYADGVCIYNDVFSLDDMKVVNPKLTLEDSCLLYTSLKKPRSCLLKFPTPLAASLVSLLRREMSFSVAD